MAGLIGPWSDFPDGPELSSGLSAVGGLTDHLDLAGGFQQHPEPGPDQLVVIGKQHPYHTGLPSTGTTPVTLNPPPSGPARRSPPSAVTRSRIPRKP